MKKLDSARVLAGLTSVLLFTVPSLAQVQKKDVPGIVNYSRADATVACGGATDPVAFRGLKDEGFAAVVNLRLADEPGANVEQERAAAQEAGLNYFHIPFNSGAPTSEPADAFLAIIADPKNSPVYIHCASAGRAGAMLMIKRVLADGWTVEKALAEAEAIGMTRPQLKDFALGYIAAHRQTR
jgi:uncharacterized protein (TIGR01244 family)